MTTYDDGASSKLHEPLNKAAKEANEARDPKRTVTIDDVRVALSIREAGGSWSAVIEATGFNGSTLRPHIARHLASPERLNRPPVEKGDRTDSPHAVVLPVELTTESIDRARFAGMAWYSIAQALDVSEAEVKSLASPEAQSRVYAGRLWAT
jgi:hypothetical protein